ncbi:MAG TPA: GGDEF domain-containing protein, partial [Chloroflexota bacterium]|nr:GGDEF domain-containing protein [Chloroflexota bacterium]
GDAQPFPSTADLFRLAGYPLAVAAILTLPTRRIPLVVRARIILDGLMFVAASMTVSWYFIIGPAQLLATNSLSQVLIANAYPGADTLLLLSLAFLAFQLRERRLRLTFILFCLCFIALTASDTIYNSQLLDGSFATDGLVNVGWSAGWMFGVLAAAASGQIPAKDRPGRAQAAGTVGEWSVWRSIHPFVLVPAVGGLFFYAWQVDSRSPLIDGVAVGFAALLMIVLLREVLVEIENRRLYRDLVAINSRLAALATIDPLTDLPNHRALVDVVDAEIERAKRFRRPFAILFCDLDHFKELNDTYGHAAGDAALRLFGELIRRAIRATDVVGRWGGEEFLIILPELDTRGASILAERLRVKVAGQEREPRGQQLTCSIGVAMYPNDGLTRDAVIDAADLAMYLA